MIRPVVGIAGLIGSGKTTVAKYLVENHNFVRISFAGTLKNMAKVMGLTDEELNGDLKEKPCHLIGNKTPRQFMQLLGTEFGRTMIDPQLWVRAWRRQVELASEGRGVVADDVRFPNEANAVREASHFNLMIRVVRGSSGPQQHASELQTFPVDVTILNEGSIETLYAKIDHLLRPCLAACEIENAG